jgi:predicted extracellular nuclease
VPLRIATFNLENLDSDDAAFLARRIAILRPQLLRLNADILCLQEVNSEVVGGRRQLDGLNQLIAGTPYAAFHLASTKTVGNDFYAERNVVTLSRFPIAAIEIIRDSAGPRPSYQHFTAQPADTTADPVEWERPILYVQVDIGQGRTVHVINLHLKSKLASSIPGQKIDNFTWRSVSAWAEGSFVSAMKRVGQAVQARLKVDEIFDNLGEGAFVVVAGDFNAEAQEVPVRAICGPVEETGNPDHGPRLMVPCENHISESSRFSLYHLGRGQMLDHVLASRSMLASFLGAEIHNEALPDESGAFRTDVKFPESDHAPVLAEFSLVP